MGTSSIPRPEYPRPQFVRPDWMNLNGPWEFEIDSGRSGKDRKLYEAPSLQDAILVPFCPESKLSGIGNTDFMAAVWYRRTFEVPASWQDSLTVLHIGASDYDTEVWINGVSAGTHRGGYTPISLDISALLTSGVNTVTVCAQDDVRSGLQPRGKQSALYHSHGCDYTRTTGIWQTVWLERVPRSHIAGMRLVPDTANGCVSLTITLHGAEPGCVLKATAKADGAAAGEAAAIIDRADAQLTVPLSPVCRWSPEDPFLYDLTLKLVQNGRVLDRVDSYFGLRSVAWSGRAITLNGKPVFQRLVLDQGFYPDGVYTAPSDGELKADIERSMAMGFNGARLHQKVFEPRYLYWADKLGYLVWGEYASWGLDITTPLGLERFLPEWMESVNRDFNHPSVVGWCPFNETWDKNGTRQDDHVLSVVYQVTKAMDPTRPVIDTSGNYHVVTDIYDIHDYEQNPTVYAQRYDPAREDKGLHMTFPTRQQYGGQPYFVSEYGGIWWNPDGDDKAWGYGKRPQSGEEFMSRYEGLTRTLLDNPGVCAFCYTQLTDVEQEVNGLYTYDRRPKFDPELIRRVNTLPAAIEKEK